jgi:hypothetical protein
MSSSAYAGKMSSPFVLESSPATQWSSCSTTKLVSSLCNSPGSYTVKNLHKAKYFTRVTRNRL